MKAREPKPRIVFLDAGTLDYGDIHWEPLSRLGAFVPHHKTNPDEVLTRLKNADVAITNKVVLDKKVLAKLRGLKLIAVAATGYNNVDVKVARQNQIAVTNVQAYAATSVAEQTLLFLLALAHRFLSHAHSAQNKAWSRSDFFCVTDFPFAELKGQTLGLVGYGDIGKAVAKLAKAFGMNVLIAKLPGRKYAAEPRRTAFKTILKACDFLTLHCPLTQETKHLIGKKELTLMKPTAALLNLARGPIVDEAAVAAALRQNRLAGFAADVLSVEPPPPTHPLLAHDLQDKVILTPHVAWASREARQKLVDEIADNVAAFFGGKKRNRVD